MNSHEKGHSRGRKIARGPHPRAALRPPARPPLGPPRLLVLAQAVDAWTGAPIAGARCEVLDPAGTLVARPTTDWRGAIEVEVALPGDYAVRVLGTPRRGAGGPGNGTAFAVFVEVVDERTGAPLPGARIEVLDPSGAVVAAAVGAARADARGRAEVPVAAAGEYTVRVIEV